MKRLIPLCLLLSLLCFSSNAFCESRTYGQTIEPKLDLLVQKNKTLKISLSSKQAFTDEIVWFAAQDHNYFKYEIIERDFPYTGNYLQVTPLKDNGSTILYLMNKSGTPCIVFIRTTTEKVNYDSAWLRGHKIYDISEWKREREENKRKEFPEPPFTIKNGSLSATQEITDTAAIVLQMGKTTKVICEEPISFFATPSPNRVKVTVSSANPKILELTPLESNIEASIYITSGINSFYFKTIESNDYKYFDSYPIKAGEPYDSADDESDNNSSKTAEKLIDDLLEKLF